MSMVCLKENAEEYIASNHYIIDSKGKCKINDQDSSINIQIEDVINLTENSKAKYRKRKEVKPIKIFDKQKWNDILESLRSVSLSLYLAMFIMLCFLCLLLNQTNQRSDVNVFAAFISFTAAIFYGPINLIIPSSPTQYVKYFLWVMCLGIIGSHSYFIIVNYDLWKSITWLNNYGLQKLLNRNQIGNTLTALSLLILFVDKFLGLFFISGIKKKY